MIDCSGNLFDKLFLRWDLQGQWPELSQGASQVAAFGCCGMDGLRTKLI